MPLLRTFPTLGSAALIAAALTSLAGAADWMANPCAANPCARKTANPCAASS